MKKHDVFGLKYIKNVMCRGETIGKTRCVTLKVYEKRDVLG